MAIHKSVENWHETVKPNVDITTIDQETEKLWSPQIFQTILNTVQSVKKWHKWLKSKFFLFSSKRSRGIIIFYQKTKKLPESAKKPKSYARRQIFQTILHTVKVSKNGINDWKTYFSCSRQKGLEVSSFSIRKPKNYRNRPRNRKVMLSARFFNQFYKQSKCQKMA